MYQSTISLQGCFPGNDCCAKCRAGVGSLPDSPDELNFQDKAVLSEIRTAMVWSPVFAEVLGNEPELAELFSSQAFLEDPVWGVDSTKLAYIWMDQYEKYYGPLDVETNFKAPSMYPTAVGVTLIMGLLGYFGSGSEGLSVQFPNLAAYMDVVGAASGEGGEVLPPFLSETAKQSGSSSIKANTLAMAGIGAVAVAILFLTLRGK